MKTQTKTQTSYFHNYIMEISESKGFYMLCELIFTARDIYEVLDEIEKKGIQITSDDVEILYSQILDNPENGIPGDYKTKVEHLLDMFFDDLPHREEVVNGRNIVIWGYDK